MRVCFQKERYGLNVDIETPWMIQSVNFKSGCYRASALNEIEFNSLLKYLKKHFSSLILESHTEKYIALSKGQFSVYSSMTAEGFRFTFKDEADEAYFKILSFDGIER